MSSHTKMTMVRLTWDDIVTLGNKNPRLLKLLNCGQSDNFAIPAKLAYLTDPERRVILEEQLKASRCQFYRVQRH